MDAPAISPHHTTIAGLEHYAIGLSDGANSFASALAGMMRTLNQPYDYPYLMGMSGAAFRLQLWQPGITYTASKAHYCPSAPHACCGHECVTAAWESIPFQRRSIDATTAKDDPARFAALWDAVTASIDAGLPVLMAAEEYSLVTGYDSDTQTLYCRAYVANEPGYVAVDSGVEWAAWPWKFEIVEPAPLDIDPDRLYHKALKRAVLLPRLKRAMQPDDTYYLCGVEAWERWIDQLRNEALHQVDAGAQHQNLIGNAHTYTCLHDARTAAAAFLERASHHVTGDARRHVVQAAAHYHRVVRELQIDQAHRIAPYPWMLPAGQPWTQAMRNRQATLLETAAAIERLALEELQSALALIE